MGTVVTNDTALMSILKFIQAIYETTDRLKLSMKALSIT